MKLASSLCLFASILVIPSSFAAEPWWLRTVFNSDQMPPSTHSLIHDVDLFDCGEQEGTLLCSDETQYYDLNVFVELELGQDTVSTTRFSMPYTSLNDTKAQLYLRKDGLNLTSVEVGEVTFDVLFELDRAKERGDTPESVDKALVTFINGAKSGKKRMVWHWPENSEATVVMIKRDDEIVIELSRDKSAGSSR